MNLFKTINAELKAWRYILRNRLYVSAKSEKEIVDHFHKLYYDSNIFGKTFVNTFWLGTPTLKCPLDLWVYQEIIYDLKPDLIIETGTAEGGSALFLATMLDILGKGEIITIDIQPNDKRPQHKRIRYLLGSSTGKEIIETVKRSARENKKIMVILDSDHSQKHVLEELRTYSPIVSRGQYLIVEDSNVNGHPVFLDHGPGPMEAIDEFLKENNGFTVDKSKEKFYLTFNPKGYLLKVK